MDETTQTVEQPEADSTAESRAARIESIFGGDTPTETTETASEQTETTEAAPVEESFEYEYEGTKYSLPKALEKAVMQERDYTQKAQTLAEQRRAIEIAQRNAHLAELAQSFQTETAQEHQQLQALEWALSQPVDWFSMTTEDALRRKLQMDTWAQEKARIEKVIGDKRKEWEGKQNETFTKLVKESLEVVAKRIPGWGPELARQVTEHALKEGFTDTELRKANTDPRLAVTLWKAQQYDLLKAKATAKPAQAKGVVKTATANPMPQAVKDKLALRKAVKATKPGSPERKAAVNKRIASIFG